MASIKNKQCASRKQEHKRIHHHRFNQKETKDRTTHLDKRTGTQRDVRRPRRVETAAAFDINSRERDAVQSSGHRWQDGRWCVRVQSALIIITIKRFILCSIFPTFPHISLKTCPSFWTLVCPQEKVPPCCSVWASVGGSDAHETPKQENNKAKTHSLLHRLVLSAGRSPQPSPLPLHVCEGRTRLHHKVVAARRFLLHCRTWRAGESGSQPMPVQRSKEGQWWSSTDYEGCKSCEESQALIVTSKHAADENTLSQSYLASWFRSADPEPEPEPDLILTYLVQTDDYKRVKNSTHHWTRNPRRDAIVWPPSWNPLRKLPELLWV